MTEHLMGAEELPGTGASNRTDGGRAAAAAARASARAAVEAAERAFPAWSATSPAERRGAPQGASGLLVGRQAGIPGLCPAGTGRNLGWGAFTRQAAAGLLAYSPGP